MEPSFPGRPLSAAAFAGKRNKAAPAPCVFRHHEVWLKNDSLRCSVTPSDTRIAHALFGQHNCHLRQIETLLPVALHSRGQTVTISAADPLAAELAQRLLLQLAELLEKGYPLYPADIDCALNILRADRSARLVEIFFDTVLISARHKMIGPKTLTQKQYIDAIRQHDIVFGVGPAGTGKTYLAMALAVAAWQRKEVRRILLVRPAVEAGEKLGFLPGDIAEKVNPYLQPLYDALFDMVDFKKGQELITEGLVEVAPLAFMRGRTLNDSFIILDEAQNTTSEQMKMFLTRLGFGSKAVITGDTTQVDLPAGRPSGLLEALQLLEGVEGIAQCHFTDVDVVRHPLVQRIVRAYDRAQAAATAGRPAQRISG
ncbi:MAG: PhoH family protein [Desulfuromonas thiophila]|uniref:PhoH-like protein n=1 Tax=Desulfuromonas thiophila TaxID=57664 RepID=A0A1G7BSK0_9BACT|nr:PhoH family protein [Desulfuromonas thiophila]MCK9172590.1 PhoH family protein [Desulfuromonas thiophila]MDD3802654.1 PhoH family protein [Desulfuromonas thiophila]SDE29346.1 phosphate starvation-inducible protein PhoH [Desulfuromonas thiophila]